jgi:phosphatidylinositol-3-phosphatase
MWLFRRLIAWAAVGGLLLWITSLLLGPATAPGSTSRPPVALAPSQSSTSPTPGRAGTPTAKPTASAHATPAPTRVGSPSPTASTKATPTATPKPTATPASTPSPTPAPTPTPTQAPTPTPTVTPAPTPTPTPTPALPTFSHVFIIVMENEESTSLIGNASAPYINGLANSYGLATQYYGVSHPSLPNYLALTAGSTFGITSDCENCFLNQTNLADQIEASGRTWRAYMESMPSPCDLTDTGTYGMWHNPWLYYNDIRTNTTRCNAGVVPYTHFATDLATSNPPNFMWVTPNLCSDMHDCSIATGDNWLKQQVPVILNSAAYRNGGVLFITWDEGSTNAGCCTNAAGGRVATLVISPLAKTGFQSSVAETHYSLLRTIEDSWNLPRLGGAGCSCTAQMREYFR